MMEPPCRGLTLSLLRRRRHIQGWKRCSKHKGTLNSCCYKFKTRILVFILLLVSSLLSISFACSELFTSTLVIISGRKTFKLHNCHFGIKAIHNQWLYQPDSASCSNFNNISEAYLHSGKFWAHCQWKLEVLASDIAVVVSFVTNQWPYQSL